MFKELMMLVVVLLTAGVSSTPEATAQGTAFNYQGRLTDLYQ